MNRKDVKVVEKIKKESLPARKLSCSSSSSSNDQSIEK
jgi:hypothetical protein